MGRQQNPRDIKANGGINGTVERVNFYNLPTSAIGGGHHRGKWGQEKRQTDSGIGGEVKEMDQLDLFSTPKLSGQTQRDPIPQSCQIQNGHTSEASRNGWLLPDITLNN